MVFGNSIVYLLKGGYNMKTRAGTFCLSSHTCMYIYIYIFIYVYCIT